MAVRVQPTMSPGCSARITEVAAMSDVVFRKRFRSPYESLPSPSPTLPVWKRYRGTSELVLSTDSEADKLGDEEDSLDSDNRSEGAEDEGPAAWDEDPDMSDGRLGLGEDEAVLEGQGSGSTPEPERLEGVSAFRQPTLTTWTDPEDGSLPISPPHFDVPSPISSPLISLTVPSPVATPTATILVDENQFIDVGAQLELYGSILQDHTQRLDALPPTLFVEIDRDVRELYTRSGAVRDEIFSQRPVLALEAWAGHVDTRMASMSQAGYDDHRLVHDLLVQQAALQRELQEMRGRVTALEQERDRREQ
ncbi:hypothetical protein Tco_0852355 [Tanacetum coccineum]